MSVLIGFLKENEDLLSEAEYDAISFGLHAIGRLQEESIKELNAKPRSTAELSDLKLALELGLSQVWREKTRSSKERDNGDLLVLLWEYLLPDMQFAGREVDVRGVGRADLIALDSNGTDVVIELKAAASSLERKAKEQVNSYAKTLSKLNGRPFTTMLINETGVLSDEMDVITWSDLGIFNGKAYAPDCFDIGELSEICNVHNVYPEQIEGRYAYPYNVLWDYLHGGL